MKKHIDQTCLLLYRIQTGAELGQVVGPIWVEGRLLPSHLLGHASNAANLLGTLRQHTERTATES